VKHLLDRNLFNPHWRTIKIVAQARVLGISATTIIVAPLFSRTLIALNEMEPRIRQAHPILDALFPIIKLHFELPLSIKLVVGSAFCALLGKVIYEMRCPLYLKAGDNYEQFRHSQAQATSVLSDAFLRIMQGSDQKKKGEIVSHLQAVDLVFHTPSNPTDVEWKQDTHVQFLIRGGGSHPGGPLAYTMRFPDHAEAIFYVLRDVMDDSRRPARAACALFYAAAILLLAGALLIQLWWMVRGMLQ
jgi:hypothetical protein